MIYFNAEAISHPFPFRLIFEIEFVAILVNFDTCKKNSASGPESLEHYKPNQDASLPVTHFNYVALQEKYTGLLDRTQKLESRFVTLQKNSYSCSLIIIRIKSHNHVIGKTASTSPNLVLNSLCPFIAGIVQYVLLDL